MIRLTEANRDKVAGLLASTNGRCREHVWQDADAIYGLAQEAERQLAQLGIAKARRIGAEYCGESGPSTLPKAYGWAIKVNVAMLVRGKQGWMVERLYLSQRKPGEHAINFLSLTAAQDEEACQRFRSSRYKVMRASKNEPIVIATEHDRQPEPSRL